ncbi:prenyltransferase/squalene oxidase repeat-containing protein [Prosthecobacter sp.]|uniref:prenyltransferase/squalene oxidase repeat-containing protein n=1 Tax=Prosthecobacter sp. TaxID=1965333 RepID=UPI0037853199
MKTISFCFFLLTGAAMAQTKQEVQGAISRGVEFLKGQQNAESGHWVTKEDPALSALVLSAMIQNPAGPGNKEELKRGYDFLLRNVQPDGGIYTKARSNYNTAICLMALVLRASHDDEEVIRRARNFVAHQQNDADTPGKTDNPFDGGIGYGGGQQGGAHADMSNTSFALEALYYSKKMFQDTGKPVEKKEDLNWDAAIQFVSRCQNFKATNDQPWAGVDKENIGAFGYTPVPQAPRGGKKDGGPVPMRYYGSISYAGMLSFIYAGLTPEDPRMKAALEWLGSNYTVDENPGMGAEGLYYYYHTMAKALATAGITQLKTKSGAADWTADLSRKLISLQNSDGSWANKESGRWMESDPVLVTAYTVLALEQVHRAMK